MKRPILFALFACALGVALAAALLRPRERVAALRGTSSPDAAESAFAAIPDPSVEAPEPSAAKKAPATERSAVERRVRFLVRDERGGAIEGASLRLSSSAGCAELARTDAEGRASLTAAEVPKARAIWVTAPSYTTAFVETDSIESDRVELTLRAGGWIAGVVRTAGGEPAGAHVTVFALPRDELERREPSQLERLLCRDALSVSTDARGCFRIDGLVGGESYLLVAYRTSADGWSCSRDKEFVASSSDARLELREVYASMLRFTCANEAQMARFFRDPEVEAYASGSLGNEANFEHAIAPNLAGWTEALRADRCEPLIFSGAEGLDAARRSVWCHVEIPGFALVRERVELAPVCKGRLVEHRIELVPDADGAGSLLVELTGPYAELAARMGLEAKLALYSAPDDRITTFVLRWSGGERVARLDEVPSGRYRWTTFFGRGLRPAPPPGEEVPRLAGPFALADGGEARLEFELPPIAYLAVECRRDGQAFAGTALLCDEPRGEAGGRLTWRESVVCRDTPQPIGPLVPGRYGLALAESTPPPIEDASAIELAAGEEKHVVLEAR